MQTAATALLKRYQAAGYSFSATLAARLLELLPAAADWESRLHFLQMLPALPIPSSHTDSLCECLWQCFSDRNKFVRAWAYGGLHRLASLYPEYGPEVAALLDRAGQEESASCVRVCGSYRS